MLKLSQIKLNEIVESVVNERFINQKDKIKLTTIALVLNLEDYFKGQDPKDLFMKHGGTGRKRMTRFLTHDGKLANTNQDCIYSSMRQVTTALKLYFEQLDGSGTRWKQVFFNSELKRDSDPQYQDIKWSALHVRYEDENSDDWIELHMNLRPLKLEMDDAVDMIRNALRESYGYSEKHE